jgi:ribosomal protein L10
MKSECKVLKNNLLSRIIQTAEACYTQIDSSLKEEAQLAYSMNPLT